MKILILGEYSKLLTNLRLGLEENGIQISHVHDGDNKKSISGASFNIGTQINNKFLRYVVKFVKYLIAFTFYFKNDAVVIVNQTFFKLGYLDILTITILRKFNKQLILMACGDDVPFIDYGKSGKMEWWVHQRYDNCPGLNKEYFQTQSVKFIHNFLCNRIDKVIPTTFTYKLCWEHSDYSEKVTEVWNPIVDVDKHAEYQDVNRDKIKILHGRNRPCEKGSPIIEDALKKLHQEWHDKIEIIVFDLVPLKKYNNLVREADIIIDQCLGYDYGSINCISSIAAGKTVLVSTSKESLEYNNIKDGEYFYAISPSSEVIYNCLDGILRNWPSKKISSRSCMKFIKERHDKATQSKLFLREILG